MFKKGGCEDDLVMRWCDRLSHNVPCCTGTVEPLITDTLINGHLQ
jgi:hypothetical protein